MRFVHLRWYYIYLHYGPLALISHRLVSSFLPITRSLIEHDDRPGSLWWYRDYRDRRSLELTEWLSHRSRIESRVTYT